MRGRFCPRTICVCTYTPPSYSASFRHSEALDVLFPQVPACPTLCGQVYIGGSIDSYETMLLRCCAWAGMTTHGVWGAAQPASAVTQQRVQGAQRVGRALRVHPLQLHKLHHERLEVRPCSCGRCRRRSRRACAATRAPATTSACCTSCSHPWR